MQETPSNIGPYRILGTIGQGGMGVVYQGQHLDTGDLAAVKTVRLPDEGLLQSIRREIHALARLRHPGIVQIVGEGVEQGLPWYAMELLQGVPLNQGWSSVAVAWSETPTRADAENRAATGGPDDTAAVTGGLDATAARMPAAASTKIVPVAGTTRARPRSAAGGSGAASRLAARAAPAPGDGRLPQVLKLMVRLCAPLGYLHGEGLVHRDLKPQNVLVRPGGWPVLIDFGLLSQFAGEGGREHLDLGELTVGTAAYMAPEQIRGQLVDARADLYALGCILFELLTGRRPFVARDVNKLLDQHLEDAPPRPSELADGIPPELEKLILRLLQKEPEARLGYAADLARALIRLGSEADAETAGPPARTYLYRPGFGGRQRELRLLLNQLKILRSEAGAMVLIGAQSGMGKTRLAVEIARRAALGGIQVLVGESLSPVQAGGGKALQPLKKMLRLLADRCRERGAPETERLFGRNGKLLELYEPALAGLPGLEAGEQDLEGAAAVSMAPAAVKERLYPALAEMLLAVAQEKPLLLVLDDLQWADELTLGFLEHLLGAWFGDLGGPVPVLIVGAYRSEEVAATGESPLQGLLAAAEAAVQPILQLGPLDEDAVASMCGGMLALSPPPARLSRFLTRESEGNPFFVAEYLRTAVAEGLLWRNEQGHWRTQQAGPEGAEGDYESLPLPHSLQQLVGRRLDDLSAGAAALAQSAAVLGREFGEGLLAETVQLDSVDLMECMRELLVRQVLEPVDAGWLHFVHDKFREAVYERIPAEARRGLHGSAARAIEALPEQERRQHFAALGYHWEQAGEKGPARRAYRAGAKAAVAQGALGEAERLYRAVQALVEVPDEESLDGLLNLVFEVLHLQGRNEEARELLLQALDRARAFGLKDAEGRSLRGLGILAWLTGVTAEACALLESALTIVRELGDRKQEVEVLNVLATIHMQRGQTDEARRLYLRAIELSEEAGDPVNTGIALCNLSILNKQEGFWSESRSVSERAVELFRRTGQGSFLGNALQGLAATQFEQGYSQEAIASYQEALSLHRRLGDRRNETYTLYSIAQIELAFARDESAREASDQALDFSRRSGEAYRRAINLHMLARLDLNAGLPVQARDRLTEALRGLRGAQRTDIKVELYLGLVRLERLTGPDLLRSRRLLRRAGVIERSGEDVSNALSIACARGHMALASNRSARRQLEAARQIAARLELRLPGLLAQEVERLERAQEAFLSGRPLWRGERGEDLPAGLRRWLHKAGLLEAGPSP